EDDSRVAVFLRRIAPDIEIFECEIVPDDSRSCGAGVTDSGCSYSATRLLEPRVLVGSVIDHQLGDDTQIALMCRLEKCAKIFHPAQPRINIEIIPHLPP